MGTFSEEQFDAARDEIHAVKGDKAVVTALLLICFLLYRIYCCMGQMSVYDKPSEW